MRNQCWIDLLRSTAVAKLEDKIEHELGVDESEIPASGAEGGRVSVTLPFDDAIKHVLGVKPVWCK